MPQTFGQAVTSKKRFVTFVIKYTGGATYSNGVGHWNFGSVLAPIAPYKSDICIPQGLNCEFKMPMNSHAAPQISALTGALSGYVKRDDTYYPTGNLANYASGNGKSIDVLIGEKLKAQYNCQLSNLQISNYSDPTLQASTYIQSSYGANGVLLPTFSSVNELSNELKNRIKCTSARTDAASLAFVNRKINALEFIKSNSEIFGSKYIVDKEIFEDLKTKTQRVKEDLSRELSSNGAPPALCGNFPTLPRLSREYINETSISRKMNAMYDLAIAALQANVTRSLTVNLMTSAAHLNSHYLQDPPVDKYLRACTFLQIQIGNFLAKLKSAGMYNDTLIFCNAGSCMTNECHNYENLATYVINGGKTGIVGSPSTRKPVGSLLVDILRKFDIPLNEYGGTNHKYGVGKPGSFI